MTNPTNPNQPTSIEADDFFGTAKYTAGTEYFSPEQGSTSWRIAPPVKTFRPTGQWYTRGALHYGYTVPNPKNPDKPFHKPFICIQKKNWDTGMIVEECPECTLIATRKASFDRILAQKKQALVDSGVAEKAAEEQAKQAMKGPASWFKAHNLDVKQYVLAKNEAGQWGVLQMRGSALDAVKKTFGAYTKKTGKEALDHREGVWVTINRDGEGLQTKYTAEVTMVDVGDGSMRFKTGQLTQNDIQSIMALPDLATLFDRQRLTFEQIAQLAKSDNNPEVAAKIFAKQAEAPVSNLPPEVVSRVERPPPMRQEQAVAQSAPAPVVAPAVIAKPAVDPAEALKTQLAALQAQLASLQPGAVPTPASGESDMSLEEFNREFGG